MGHITSERLATLIHRYLPKIINNHLKDSTKNFLTITEVRLTRDLGIATVYFTLLENSEKERENAIHLLGRHKGSIKKDLAKDLKNVRKIPELLFTYDESLNYGNKIEKILSDLKKDESK